jgi:hypothetical protein
MVRAVEILAQIAEEQMASAHALPPPVDAVIAALGLGYAYPAKGWETYAMRASNARYLLSAPYREDVLAGVDYYIQRLVLYAVV